jgi:hypothetical protein
MRKLNVLLVVLLVATIALGAIVLAFGAEGDPGTSSDPIVTKSYVDRAIENLRLALTEKIENGAGSSGTGGKGSAWQIVQAAKGQSVIGGQGTQIILRSGKALAIDNGSSGVSDLTGGADLMMDELISANHLLLVPRADGRGIKCETECWIMVLGAYELK